MTSEERIKELSAKIAELQKEIEFLKNRIVYEDDELFLLSINEYNKYKDKIPCINTRWWLRSPGSNSGLAAYVNNDGSVSYNGYNVNYFRIGVRPVLHLESNNHKIGARVIVYDAPWIVIDDGLVIAEVPIGFEKFDSSSNDYETSYIRNWLKEWKESR